MLRIPIFILGTLLAFSSSSFASLTQGVSVLTNWEITSKMSEESAPPSEHKSGMKFLGGMGLGLNYTMGWNWGPLTTSLLAEYGWKDETLRRDPGAGGTVVEYNFQTNRLVLGTRFSIPLGGEVFQLVAEYLPLIEAKTIYSDEKTENPFRKNDVLKGNGFGGGVCFLMRPLIISAIFRQVTYNNVQTNGTSRTLPDSLYSTLTSQEVAGLIGIAF